jgi:hypothetical protein
MIEYKGYFFLTHGKNTLEIRFPSYRSKPFLKIRGKSAENTYNVLRNILDAYKLNRNVREKDGKTVRELSAAIGLSVTTYLLAAYNVRNPAKYAFIIEKMVNGDLSISKYFTNFIEMCIDLSSYNGGNGSGSQLIDKKAAIAVSKSLRAILDSLL